MRPIRLLFLSDTHLGFDLPERPRVEKCRRGEDFFANYALALAPAFRGEVDAVVHGGDVLYRSRVQPGLVRRAFEPLIAIAEEGTPVFIVPGNHERSHIPHGLLVAHRRLHVFDRPRSVRLETEGGTLAIAGFPFAADARERFAALVERTGWTALEADRRVLCVHQAFEGARVGPADFTFRDAPDVVRHRDVPRAFDAVLSGHIHRAQLLRHDLAGRPLVTPVAYPGSIERTSIAERSETKGFLRIELPARPEPLRWQFERLPARPMEIVELEPGGRSLSDLGQELSRALGAVHPRSVVTVRTRGEGAAWPDGFGERFVRALAPPEMTIALAAPRPVLR